MRVRFDRSKKEEFDEGEFRYNDGRYLRPVAGGAEEDRTLETGSRGAARCR